MKITKQHDNLNVFPYIAYIPENISDHPALLIHLHGGGERGNGREELDKVLIHGFPKTVNDTNFRDCILIMPQCPIGTFWTARIESLKRFIDEMIVKYSADTDRIYLCGLSMGGVGTWFTALAYPDLFAAIAPCCGLGMEWNASLLKMPIWTFHGLEDSVIPAKHTIDMVEALKPLNPHLKYDLYEGVGHDSWNRAFSKETLGWILSQKKSH